MEAGLEALSETGPDPFRRLPVTRIFPERREARLDPVVVEAPLAIEVNGEPWMVTMRTPGDDRDLALGLLFSEAVIDDPIQLVRLAHCGEADPPGSLLRVELARGIAPPRARALFASSACGVCGTTAIDELAHRFDAVRPADLDEALLIRCTEELRPLQKVFQLTGALHGAALLDGNGRALQSAEDVGRHNAVDKVLGAALRSGDLRGETRILAVTSRVGFEIAAKAWAAGVQALIAVGAPSDLAVSTCQRAGILLGGFATGGRINVY